MRIDLIAVPYDSGHRGIRMGKGPDHLLQRGLPSRLGAAGHQVFTDVVESRDRFPIEIKTSFELYRGVAERVAAASKIRSLPVVLSGNCGAATGAAAGVGTERLALLWFDAHGDYMTPSTTASGFLDGMAISVAAGRCWERLAFSIPGFAPIDPALVVHAGARDWDPGERERLEEDGGTVVDPAALRAGGIGAAFDRLTSMADRLLVHVDLDVLDPEVTVANPYPAPGGLTVEEIIGAIDEASARLPIAAIVLASFDPSADESDRGTEAAMRIVAGGVEIAQTARERMKTWNEK
jgi:arginase